MTTVDKGLRLANFIIDTIVCLVLTIVLNLVVYYFFYPQILDDNSIAFEIVFSGVTICYYFFMEYCWGQTLGKMLTKTSVVDINGHKPTFFNLLIRTLLRLVQIDALSFLFGFNGLHDLLSKTTVIKVSKSE